VTYYLVTYIYQNNITSADYNNIWLLEKNKTNDP